ncbi:hypothetical protein PR048_027101 [Dryococelus australis]|uniref:Uncharacterized protein n=1 Tax=Dryococelus australis TaxID=614101 RepID=A0ABQ9GEH5_9NEOP|nr:hypothetical protein PR048_027101 [Dryococelus australis]
MEERRNERVGKRKSPEKTHQPAASSCTIPTCENSGAASPGIEHGSSRGAGVKITAIRPMGWKWMEASRDAGAGKWSVTTPASRGASNRGSCMRLSQHSRISPLIHCVHYRNMSHMKEQFCSEQFDAHYNRSHRAWSHKRSNHLRHRRIGRRKILRVRIHDHGSATLKSREPFMAKAIMKSHARPKSIAQLMEWLQEEWRRIPVDVLQTLVESMPDRVAAVIAARDHRESPSTSDVVRHDFTVENPGVTRPGIEPELYAQQNLEPTNKLSSALNSVDFTRNSFKRALHTNQLYCDYSVFSINFLVRIACRIGTHRFSQRYCRQHLLTPGRRILADLGYALSMYRLAQTAWDQCSNASSREEDSSYRPFSHADEHFEHRLGLAVLETRPFVSREYVYVDALGRLDVNVTFPAPLHSIIRGFIGPHGRVVASPSNFLGAAVGKRFDCSSPTKVNRLAGSLPDFPKLGIVPDDAAWSTGLLGGLPFAPPFHGDAAPSSRLFTLVGSQDEPSNTLNTLNFLTPLLERCLSPAIVISVSHISSRTLHANAGIAPSCRLRTDDLLLPSSCFSQQLVLPLTTSTFRRAGLESPSRVADGPKKNVICAAVLGRPLMTLRQRRAISVSVCTLAGLRTSWGILPTGAASRWRHVESGKECSFLVRVSLRMSEKRGNDRPTRARARVPHRSHVFGDGTQEPLAACEGALWARRGESIPIPASNHSPPPPPR